MSDQLSFHHIHVTSKDAHAAAQWYVDNLGATIRNEIELRNAPQIHLDLGGLNLLIRGVRPGENPSDPKPIEHFDGYSSHNEYGTDHFALNYHGDMLAYCDELRANGVTFAVEPWEFLPNHWICYIAAPDGVSVELMQAPPK